MSSGLQGEVQIEPGERDLELVLGEQGGDVLAVRDSGQEFEQQGLGVQNKLFIFLAYVVH